MLQSIREHTQGWIAGAIISIIILTFALWGIHSYFVSSPNRAVATVNGVEIGKEQVNVAYERLRRQIQAQQGSAAVRDDAAIKAQVLTSIINNEVLKQAATKQGFLVSDMQVDAYLQSMPEFQVDGQFSVERFQQVLASTLMTTSDFLDVIRTGMLVDQPKLGMVLTSFALPEEATAAVGLVNQVRDIEYINIPRSAFTSDAKPVSQADIKAYYAAHRDEFMTPEKVSVDYVKLSLKDLYSNFHPTNADLKRFYDENASTYTKPIAWKLAAILIPVQESTSKDEITKAQAKAKELEESLSKGADFAALARNHSGKDIGKGDFVSLQQVPVALQQAVLDLKNAGQISPPVKTKDGFVILKALSIRDPEPQSFDEVKGKVKQSYIHQKADEQYAHLRERLADLAYEHPDSLAVVAKELNLQIESTKPFTKTEEGDGVLQYKKVRTVAFSNDVLELQNNSDILQVSPDTVVVVRVKSHIPSALLAVDTVAHKIKETLSLQESDQLAKAYADKLLVDMQAGKSVHDLLVEKQFKRVSAGMLGRYSLKVDTAVLELAFRLPVPSRVNKHETFGIAKLPSGFAIVAVKKVKDGSASGDRLTVFTEQFQNSEGALEYSLYKQSQIKNAKIKKLS